MKVFPGDGKSHHSEPSVGGLPNVKGFDPLVQLSEGLKVSVGRYQARLELGMGLPQTLDLLNRVTADRVSHVLLGILKPRVEGRSLLGKGQVEVLDLAELFVNLQQALLAARAVGQQLVHRRITLNFLLQPF